MIKTDFLRQLDRFSLILNKRITSNYVGDQQSEATGRGLIFKDHSVYVPGEDFRAVDWRVFARTDKLFVKRFEEERNLTVHVIIDTSGSMDFGKGPSKSEYAAMLGLGFAHLAMKNNERFVLGTFSEKLEVFRPQRGRKQLTAMLDYLNKKKPKGKSMLDQSIGSYRQLINSKSYIVIISDFLYPIEEIRRALYHLKKHEIQMIQVLDQEERDLKLEGDYKLIDSESKDQIRTFISPYMKKQYNTMMHKHVSQIANEAAKHKAKFYTADTGQNVFDVFYEILTYRGRRRSG